MNDLLRVSIEVFPDRAPRFTLRTNDVSQPDPLCDWVDLADATTAFRQLLSRLAEDAREAMAEPAEGPGSASGPIMAYTAMVVRDLVVRTPFTAHLRGIVARSLEEAKAMAEEAARRLPEPPIEPEEDEKTGWERGEGFDPEFAAPEMVALFEESDRPGDR